MIVHDVLRRFLVLLPILVRSTQALVARTAAAPNWKARACRGKHALEVKKSAACGVVMMAWGQDYSKLAYKLAARTRSFHVPKGWCPLDADLDHVPVTLYTDTPPEEIAACAEDGLNIRIPVDVRGELSLAPWEGMEGSENLNSMLGTWRMRWYHVQSILSSPYDLTLYLDVDAYPCSGHSISSLFHDVVDNGAYFGATEVLKSRCHMTAGNCTYPHPPGMPEKEAKSWKVFGERNSGVLVIDRAARPILEEWARALQRTAGEVRGDQYALREALFKYRRTIPQYIFPDSQVCRYNDATSRECETALGHGCRVHHAAYQASLEKFGMLEK